MTADPLSLIQRLRRDRSECVILFEHRVTGEKFDPDCLAAADEIERLQHDVTRSMDRNVADMAEIERLRATISHTAEIARDGVMHYSERVRQIAIITTTALGSGFEEIGELPEGDGLFTCPGDDIR